MERTIGESQVTWANGVELLVDPVQKNVGCCLLLMDWHGRDWSPMDTQNAML